MKYSVCSDIVMNIVTQLSCVCLLIIAKSAVVIQEANTGSAAYDYLVKSRIQAELCLPVSVKTGALASLL